MEKLAWTAAAILAVFAAAAPGPKMQNEYLFAEDLGPASIDVSSYPAAQREGYALFAKHCSTCHTLARSVNSAAVTRADWRPLVGRMHSRAQADRWTEIPEPETRAILDFLVYDARERKVRRKTEFDAKRKELQRLFEQVRRARGAP